MADVDIDVDINTDDAINDIRRLNGAVDSFDNRIKQADETTKKFERRIGGSFRQALQDVRVLLGAIGIGIFLRELVQVNAAFEQVRTTLVAASDNMNIVAADFAFVRAEAVRLGMPVAQVGGEFARLAAATRGTVLEGAPAREIYSSLAEAFVATGQGADEFRLAVLAVNQMVSKGRVQAEELRGQLGERLPGAYQAAARALGMTTAELSKALELGQVTADKLLPKLAVELRNTFGTAFEAARSSPRFIMGQFQVAIESLLYTLSNGGFMVEFLGMLRDISDYLASDEGARGAERLSSALGFLMAQVRALANVLVQNADTIVSVIAGLGSAGAILGIKALAGWIGNLIGMAGGLRVLLGPWSLLATAIGGSVFALSKYGDELLTLGGNTARVGDWFKAAWEVPSKAIRDFLPQLRDMIVQIPLIGDAWVAAETGLKVFQDTFAGTRNISESFQATFDSLKASLRSGLGEETWAGITSVFNTLRTSVETIKPFLTSLFDGLVIGAQIALIYVQEFGKAAWAVFMDLFDSVKNIASDLFSIFNNVWTLITSLFGSVSGETLFGGILTGATIIADVVVGIFLTMVDVVEWAIDFVSTLLDALMPVIEPIAEAIGAVFGKLVDYIQDVFNMDPDLSAFETLLQFFGEIAEAAAGLVVVVVGAVSAIAQVIGQILEVVFDVAGGIWEAFEDVVMAVVDIFSWMSSSSMDSAVQSAEAQNQGAAASASGWIKFGDIAVGVFISVIEIIGGVIKQLTNLVQAIIEVGRRFGDFFDAIGTGFAAMAQRDAAKAQEAKDKFKAIFSEPISVGFADDWRNLAGGFGDNFGVISGAVGHATQVADGFKNLETDIGSNFGRLSGAARAANARSFGPNSEINREAGANGRAWAATYFGAMADEIGTRASSLTKAATDEQRRLEEAQNKAAADAARAFADREAGIDRDAGTETAPRGAGSRGGGRQSPADRAQDRIAELAIEIAMNKQLISGLEQQNLTREQMESTIKATEALRRAGYDMTYQEAIAAGGLAAQLAAMAYEAETTENKLNDVKKAIESLGEINTENSALETQLRAAQNLAINREEYAYQLEAMKELQQNNINMTYEEAVAAGGLAEALARAAYARAQNKDAVADAEAVAAAIEGYQNETAALSGYVIAVQRGHAATVQYQAAIQAQTAVMQANGDSLWEGYAALDANEKKMYDLAYASSLVGASGKDFQQLSLDITTAFNAMVDPMSNARTEIMSWSEVTRQSLQAMYDSIAVKTPEIEYIFSELFRKLSAVTDMEMMKVSDNLGDRFISWMVETETQVSDWAGNISSIWNNAFDGMVDTLTKFVMTGKLEWRELALSIIQEITKMIIKWLVFMAIKAAANMVGIPIPAFANGGIMTSSGPVESYAKGGVANSPQLALFGEGSTPEAFVPLPDGRTIPVTLSGLEGFSTTNVYNTQVMFDASSLLGQMTPIDRMHEPRVQSFNEADTRRSDQIYSDTGRSAGDITIHTEVNYTPPAGGGAASSDSSEAQRKMMQSMAKEISQMVRVQVIEVVRDESRPGGQFNKTGRGSGF